MRNWTWRVMVGSLFVGAVTVIAVAGQESAPRDEVTSSAAESAAVRIPGACLGEEYPCWNSCTMGVDGRYPATDPRHYTPGPCGLSALLPYGRFFRTDVVPDPNHPNASVCDVTPGWSSSRLVVQVMEADGVREVTRAEGWACTFDADPQEYVKSRMGALANEAARA